jgi:hypothetical protein
MHRRFGAPLTKIRYMSGWSKTNDVVTEKYIYPTMSETHRHGYSSAA